MYGHQPDPRVDEVLEMQKALASDVSDLKRVIDSVREELRGTSKSHYSIAEVATAVSRSPYTVRNWVKQGLVKAVRVEGTGDRGRLLVPRDELEHLVRGGRGSALPAVIVGSVDAPDA